MNDLYYLTHTHPEPVAELSELALMQLTSNCLESLIKEFAKLPSEQTPDGYVHELPPPVELLQREKPLPVPKPATKWEKFAAEKGIQKRKQDRLVYDEITKKYVPRQWRKRNIDPIRDAKPGQDDFEGAQDPFAKEAADRKLKHEKQANHQLKNIQYHEKKAMRKERDDAAAAKKGKWGKKHGKK